MLLLMKHKTSSGHKYVYEIQSSLIIFPPTTLNKEHALLKEIPWQGAN